MNLFKSFTQLHHEPIPFVLGNIWDVKSAQLFEAAGYQAVGISSQAISQSFGYDDGENLPFEILLQVAKRVTESVSIPFTVDMEGGYSRSINGVIQNLEKLHDVGVVGINLEDTISGTERQLRTADNFKERLDAVTNHISKNNLQLFVNVRTDAFLLGMNNALTETLDRIMVYENAGANGIFIPCITQIDDIRQVVQATALPINVMCMPALPGFEELGQVGVKRISMGPFLFSKVYEHAGQLAHTVIAGQNFKSII